MGELDLTKNKVKRQKYKLVIAQKLLLKTNKEELLMKLCFFDFCSLFYYSWITFSFF